MAKKLLCIVFLVVALTFVFTSCKKSNGNDNNSMENGSSHTHSFSEWQTTKEATCTENGYQQRICICGENQERTITAAGHSFGQWTNIKKASCIESGYNMRYCVCGKSESQTILLTNHTYSNSYLSDSTVHWKECEFCGHKTAKENHNMGNDGTCTICGTIVGDTPGIVYEISVNGTYASVIGYIGTASQVKIAETYNGVPVKYIAEDAFKFADITSIIISDSIVSIGVEAFANCSGLKNIKFGNSLTSIGEHVFPSCTNLERVIIPDSITSIGESAFEGCSSLTSVVIGKNVKSIGSYAFYSCDSLESITIPASVTTIESYAFSFCDNLTSVTFEDPDGWSYDSSIWIGSGQIVSANLQNPFTAAKYLTHTYKKYDWYKKI